MTCKLKCYSVRGCSGDRRYRTTSRHLDILKSMKSSRNGLSSRSITNFFYYYLLSEMQVQKTSLSFSMSDTAINKPSLYQNQLEFSPKSSKPI